MGEKTEVNHADYLTPKKDQDKVRARVTMSYF